MKKLLLLLLLLVCNTIAFGQISPVTDTSIRSIFYYRVLDGELYFKANGELWTTDGTSTGTSMVKNIRINGDSDLRDPTVFKGHLYFKAYEENHGHEVWRSDGTEEGTSLFFDIEPGPGNSTPARFHVLGERMVFIVGYGPGMHTWVTDGTTENTFILKDFAEESGGVTLDIDIVSELNGELYYRVSNSINGVELWKTDGTIKGTKKLPSSVGSQYYTAIYNNELYFQGNGAAGVELWKTDGTDEGTVMVKDINPEGDSDPIYFYEHDSILYFRAETKTHGRELWRTDGSTQGTYLVKDIYPGPTSSSISQFISMNGLMYFYANSPSYGLEIWKTDGDEMNTELHLDVTPGPTSSTSAPSASLKLLNDELYFRNGERIMKTNANAEALTIFNSDNIYTQDYYVVDQRWVVIFHTYPVGTGTLRETDLWLSDGAEASFIGKLSHAQIHHAPFLHNNELFYQGRNDNDIEGLWKINLNELLQDTIFSDGFESPL